MFFAGILMFLVLVTSFGQVDKASTVQVEDAAYRMADKVCDMVMQILFLILAFTVGFFIGMHRVPSAPTLRAPTLQLPRAPTMIEIEAAELTVDALKGRLKKWDLHVTGTKEDLVKRFELAQGPRRLVAFGRDGRPQ